MTLEPRTSKTISERVDIGFHRRGNWLRRGRWWASLAALGVALLVPAWAAIDRNERIYEAGPLSTAHQLIANDCAKCHTDSWRPALRVVQLDDRLRSTPDKACTVCHAGPPHHQDQLAADTDCAACHREHHGREALARVDDRYCTQCHDNLKTIHGESQTFARHIHDFAAHPEFALFRSSQEVRSQEHKVYEVARPEGEHWTDRTELRFNHKKHCGEEGLLLPDHTRRALKCEHCHQVDLSTGGIRPISHEQHCAECHGTLLHFDEQRFADQKVAHGPVAKVRGELLDRYARLAQRRPELAEDAPLVSPEREVPGPQPKLSEAGWQWVNERVETGLDQLLNRKQLGCRYCHTVESHEDDLGDWSVVDPKIPSYWLRQAVFRHDAHQLLTCVACHSEATTSSQTADILLPRIKQCHECHGSAAKRGTARGECVECHLYHHGEGSRMDGPLSIELSVVKPENVRKPFEAGSAKEKMEQGGAP
jgi:hypothetical protein